MRDAQAGINRFGKDVTQYKDTAEEVYDRAYGRDRENAVSLEANGERETRGPSWSRGERNEDNVIELSDESELAKRIKNTEGSKYKVIRDYVLEILGGKTIVLSDGRKVIVDKSDAKEISHMANKRKTAEIARIEEIIKKAVFSAEEENVKHNKFNYFAYYMAKVKLGKKTYNVILNIGRAKNDGVYHLYELTNDIKRETADRNSDLSGPEGNRITNDFSKSTIAETPEESKQNFAEDEKKAAWSRGAEEANVSEEEFAGIADAVKNKQPADVRKEAAWSRGIRSFNLDFQIGKHFPCSASIFSAEHRNYPTIDPTERQRKPMPDAKRIAAIDFFL